MNQLNTQKRLQQSDVKFLVELKQQLHHGIEKRWKIRVETETEKRSLRSLRYRNGISHISGESLSRVTQGKQRNAIFVTQTIPLARIVL